MSKPTPRMLSELSEAAQDTLGDHWSLAMCCPPRTRAALHRRGLVEQVDDKWQITVAGHIALAEAGL